MVENNCSKKPQEQLRAKCFCFPRLFPYYVNLTATSDLEMCFG